MTAEELLIQVRERIKEPAHWTKRAYARDREGLVTDPTDPAACSWCLLGAMNCVLVKHGRSNIELPLDPSAHMEYDPVLLAIKHLRAAAKRRDYPSIMWLNDSTAIQHPQILEAVDEAIESVKAKP